MKAIECGTLIDGESDAPLRDAVVLVEDGRIREVGPREAVTVPDDAERIDHSDGTVLPGLIDAHLHLGGWRSSDPLTWVKEDVTLRTARATANLRELLAAGFTTVRDLGSRTGVGLRDAVAEGEIPGPRIFACDRIMTQTAGHADVHHVPSEWMTGHDDGYFTIVDGADECRREARTRLRRGADFLKMHVTGGVTSEKDAPDHQQFTAEEISAVTREAANAGVPVATHAHAAAGIKTALRSGVDTIEHGTYVDDEAIDLFLENDATMVPTLTITHRFVTDGARLRAEGYDVPQYVLDKAEPVLERGFEAVRTAYDAGVEMAIGTDLHGSPLLPHGENVNELELYVEEVGIDEMETIKLATKGGAAALPGDQPLGVLEPGNRADLIVVPGDPLADVSALRDVDHVYQDGERVAGDGEVAS